MNYNDRRAQASYDAMLARGDGKGDEPTYDAPVEIDHMCIVALGKTDVDVEVDISALLNDYTNLSIYYEAGEAYVSVEGVLEDVVAGDEERAATDLAKALEERGYEADTVRVQSYLEVMDR